MDFDRTSRKRSDFMITTRKERELQESYAKESTIQQPMLATTTKLVYNPEIEIMEGYVCILCMNLVGTNLRQQWG